MLHCNPDETIQPASIPGVLEPPEGPVTCAIVLPGTGSDDRFVRSVFAAPLAAVGIDLIVPPLAARRGCHRGLPGGARPRGARPGAAVGRRDLARRPCGGAVGGPRSRGAPRRAAARPSGLDRAARRGPRGPGGPPDRRAGAVGRGGRGAGRRRPRRRLRGSPPSWDGRGPATATGSLPHWRPRPPSPARRSTSWPGWTCPSAWLRSWTTRCTRRRSPSSGSGCCPVRRSSRPGWPPSGVTPRWSAGPPCSPGYGRLTGARPTAFGRDPEVAGRAAALAPLGRLTAGSRAAHGR